MYHFFAEHEHIGQTWIDLTGGDYNHIKNVLRMQPGEKLLISSGDNMDYSCHIASFTETAVHCEIDAAEEKGHELPAEIWLFQGLPKSDKMELVVQKAVELGASKIIPVAMKRSVVKLDAKKAAGKVTRWQAIAESAAKQSKRSILPQVASVTSFAEAMQQASSCDWILLPYECAEGMAYTRSCIRQIRPGQKVAIFIGPEGGFDLAELELAKEAGSRILTLGSRILRTETAGMMLLSILVYALDQS